MISKANWKMWQSIIEKPDEIDIVVVIKNLIKLHKRTIRNYFSTHYH